MKIDYWRLSIAKRLKSQSINYPNTKNIILRAIESEQWLSTTPRSIGDAVIATDIKALEDLMSSIASP
ncbi:MAG: hypothetical protein JRJ45_10285 [Deltaproteobacteria bacterium]|nr:hypothetical protein [Deltaproteobacteria bacterium]